LTTRNFQTQKNGHASPKKSCPKLARYNSFCTTNYTANDTDHSHPDLAQVVNNADCLRKLELLTRIDQIINTGSLEDQFVNLALEQSLDEEARRGVRDRGI